MIRIEIEEAGGGKWRFREASGRTEGISKIPLLDSCRALKSMGADTASQIGLFRKGSEAPDLVTTVGAGAELSVREPSQGGAPKLCKWAPYPDGE